MSHKNYTEIERKFLVIGNFKENIRSVHKITQGYITHNPEKSVRIRVKDDKAFISIKGNILNSEIERFEWEKEIAKDEAEVLLKLCSGFLIEKIRYIVEHKGYVFEVDVFEKENKGLIVAEIELSHSDQHYEKPIWLGREISHEKQYYNSELSLKPFNSKI